MEFLRRCALHEELGSGRLFYVELVNLSLAIITINGWNRLAIAFRKIPGEYQPHNVG